MPTSYTYPVHSGEITEFSDFALLCARAFLFDMREEPLDAPIPPVIEVDGYCQDRLAGAHARLAELEAMSEDQIVDSWKEVVLRASEERADGARKALEKKERYQAMLAKVRAWVPPTLEHHALKNFMIEQLEGDVERLYIPEYPQPPADPIAWWEDHVIAARDDIAYYQEVAAKQAERFRRRNEWVRDLRNSLTAKVG